MPPASGKRDEGDHVAGPGGYKKADDVAEPSPFQSLVPSTVIQETREFNATPLKIRRCCLILTRVLYLLAQGTRLTSPEATSVFFNVTKLFQSKDIALRRLMYLVIKELAPMAQDVIIVIQSLSKDINGNVDLYRANSIRVLYRIIDPSMLPAVERLLRQAIVDKEPYVSSAALVAGRHLFAGSTDALRRWVSEVQETSKSKNGMVQYHALGLLYEIKKHDRLAVTKLLYNTARNSQRSPLAHTLLIQYTAKVLADDPESQTARVLTEYLESMVRHKSEMVVYQAARALCTIPNASTRMLTSAMTTLQLMLTSNKPISKFAAVRALNQMADVHPVAVTTAQMDLENLISDTNRSISTLAITTLLKTAKEHVVERLMQQIRFFVTQIPDEFKIVVVDSLRTLCLKFPQKHRATMTVLSSVLRAESGGYEYKKRVIDTLLMTIEKIPESKDAGLTHLCEFIEDSAFTQLSTRVLHVLGELGPSTARPSKYIRYIYNRVILENPTIRASAVHALAKFGAQREDLRPQIVTLLRRCMYDNDDEVRDRVTLSLAMLEQGRIDQLVDSFEYPIENLEQALKAYQAAPSDQPFDLTQVSLAPVAGSAEAEAKAAASAAGESATANALAASAPGAGRETSSQAQYAAQLAAMPALASLGMGALFKSSKPVELTESELEYVVNVVKHVFDQHLVLQFNITNTLQEAQLENVLVDVEPGDAYAVLGRVPCAVLPYNAPGSSYVVLQRTPGVPQPASMSCSLRYLMKEVDPSTGDIDEDGYDDDYQLEDLDIVIGDFMDKTFVPEFKAAWENLGDASEVKETYHLSSMRNLPQATHAIIDLLGMQPCDRTDGVDVSASTHVLRLSGMFVGNEEVLARARMKVVSGAVAFELAVRTTNSEVGLAVANAIE